MSEFTNSPEQLKKIATAMGIMDIQYHPDNNNLIYPKDPSNGDFTVVCYNPKENAKQLLQCEEFLISKKGFYLDSMPITSDYNYVMINHESEFAGKTIADAVLTAIWEVVN